MSDILRVLAVGDTVGGPGRNAIIRLYPRIKKELGIDFFVANCENTAGGNGITQKIAEELMIAGVDCITLGDHVWDQKDISKYLSQQPRLLRPLNYPPGVPGRGSSIVQAKDGTQVAVINALGRVFMHVHSDNPFTVVKAEVDRLRQTTKIVILDFHTEATSEKVAMFRYLDGQASLIFGTHTHIQTADEQVSAKGTAYITDCGMTGPYDGIIGRVSDQVLYRFLTQMPKKMEVAAGDARLSGVIVDIEKSTGRAVKISRHQWRLE